MLSSVDLIAIDIDGTLLPSVGGDVTERTRRALALARETGIEIVIATGRRHRYTTPILERASQPGETTLICSNGSVTRQLDGTRIDHFTLPLATARGLCGALRSLGGTVVFTFDRDGSGEMVPGEMVLESFAAVPPQIYKWVEANREALMEVSPLESAFEDGAQWGQESGQAPIQGPIQGMICGTVEAMREAERWLSESEYAGTVELHRTDYPTRDLTILDVLPQGCSKGEALARIAERRGLSAGQVMAIGDNWNDRQMLEWAGHPVVMSNGAPDLIWLARQRGWQIAPHNDEDGVAQVLEAVIAERAGAAARPLERVVRDGAVTDGAAGVAR